MDNRLFGARIGKPVPEWDRAHRLPVSKWVGPVCRDGATTFRINSTFLEATEQPHMIRQWFAAGVLTATFMALGMLWVTFRLIEICVDKGWPMQGIVSMVLPVSAFIGFGALAVLFGRMEFFAKTRYPIRFNRRTQKVYALTRGRPGLLSRNKDDAVEEINWDDKSLFCVHRAFQDGYHYWIRYYKLDDRGMVEQVVTIGRDWEGKEGLQELLAQWNYWCWYMSQGPDKLPKPCLYLTEKESPVDSFYNCVYEFDFNAGLAFRLLAMPIFFVLAISRIVAIFTCSPPQWPAWVVEKCIVDIDDAFNEPGLKTPIGWFATGLAIENETFPRHSLVKINSWDGEEDNAANALLWE